MYPLPLNEFGCTQIKRNQESTIIQYLTLKFCYSIYVNPDKSFTRNTEKAHLKNIVRFKVNVPPEAAHYLFANVAHFVNVDQI